MCRHPLSTSRATCLVLHLRVSEGSRTLVVSHLDSKSGSDRRKVRQKWDEGGTPSRFGPRSTPGGEGILVLLLSGLFPGVSVGSPSSSVPPVGPSVESVDGTRRRTVDRWRSTTGTRGQGESLPEPPRRVTKLHETYTHGSPPRTRRSSDLRDRLRTGPVSRGHRGPSVTQTSRRKCRTRDFLKGLEWVPTEFGLDKVVSSLPPPNPRV